jgi:hypothetical protein
MPASNAAKDRDMPIPWTNGVRPQNDEERLTPSEARQLRRGLQQMRQGKTTPWQEVKDELGL